MCPKIVFVFINCFFLPGLIKRHFTTTSFDLWVLKVGHHMNFFSRWLATKTHYESIHIIGQTLVKNFIELLDNYALRKKIIVYVKDEGSNLNTMNITLKSIVSCDMLGLEECLKALVLGIHFPRLANMLQ